ncbi:MAG: hypothetical protein IPP91_01095 [Betaproteobacteria bacterium]|nr:hypothetical protein [Betaproteobacteria bacterium]
MVTAAAGTGVITVTGATMNAAQASCTVTVDVVEHRGDVQQHERRQHHGHAAGGHHGGELDADGAGTAHTHEGVQPDDGGVGQNSVLTFTITNPAGAPARTGLTFTDTLPAGLVISTPNGVAGTCSRTPTITATAGAGVFTVGGTGWTRPWGPRPARSPST